MNPFLQIISGHGVYQNNKEQTPATAYCLKDINLSLVWWQPAVLTLWEAKPEGYELEAILGYRVRLCLRNENEKGWIW